MMDVGRSGWISLRIRVRTIWADAVEENEYQRRAGLGRRIRAPGCHLAGHSTGILRNDLAEGIALDRNLVADVDLVVQPDQQLDESTLGRQDDVGVVGDEQVRVLAGA